jgi:hypothetical protein
MMGTTTADQLSDNRYVTRHGEGMGGPSGSSQGGSGSNREQRGWERDKPKVEYVSAGDTVGGGHKTKVLRVF